MTDLSRPHPLPTYPKTTSNSLKSEITHLPTYIHTPISPKPHSHILKRLTLIPQSIPLTHLHTTLHKHQVLPLPGHHPHLTPSHHNYQVNSTPLAPSPNLDQTQILFPPPHHATLPPPAPHISSFSHPSPPASLCRPPPASRIRTPLPYCRGTWYAPVSAKFAQWDSSSHCCTPAATAALQQPLLHFNSHCCTIAATAAIVQQCSAAVAVEVEEWMSGCWSAAVAAGVQQWQLSTAVAAHPMHL